jgi:hypothetical protein
LRDVQIKIPGEIQAIGIPSTKKLGKGNIRKHKKAGW